ncbi:MAG: hypothetical protein D3915_15835 [Candidatus Electrothrix sp. AU1_5]|nr:hypothetical protein [Candidatus Electrothrix gigas]
MSFQSLYRANTNTKKFCRLKERILQYKGFVTGTALVIGLVASLITIFDHYAREGATTSGLEKNIVYTVKLVLPARMSGATILVDKQPAVIVEQTPTVVTVQVDWKRKGHQFTAMQGEEVCTQPPQLIQENNVTINLCQ